MKRRKRENKGDAVKEKDHETPLLEDYNTISGGFSGGGTSTSSQKLYNRAVMTLETRKPESSTITSLCFAASDT